MSATSDLQSEHIGVSRMMSIMEHMALQTRAGQPPKSGDLAQAIEFLRVFVDKCHHTKEEQLLFPAIHDAGMTSVDEVVAVLLADHVKGRALVARIAAATHLLAEGDESASTELADAMAEYTTLLRAHIRREENDCFAPADRELPATAQHELAEGYERVEREVIGEGVHDGFHMLLDRLAADYQ